MASNRQRITRVDGVVQHYVVSEASAPVDRSDGTSRAYDEFSVGIDLYDRVAQAQQLLDADTVERKRPPSLQRDTAEWSRFADQYLNDVVPADEEKGAAIAAWVHRDQTDQLGADYIDHPARIAASLRDSPTAAAGLTAEQRDHAVQAAWLHDTLEDTALTVDDLRDAGFHPAVIEAVELVTSHKGQSRDDYYAAIAAKNPDGSYAHPVARALKLGDLADNNQPWRRESLPGSPSNPVAPEDVGNPDVDRFSKLGRKYAKAYVALGYPVPDHLAQFAE